jgi:hypothetical protein
VQKYSNEHNFDQNFCVLQYFGFKCLGNLYNYDDCSLHDSTSLALIQLHFVALDGVCAVKMVETHVYEV